MTKIGVSAILFVVAVTGACHVRSAAASSSSSSSSSSRGAAVGKNLADKVWTRTRRILNLSSLFGSPVSSPSSESPYDRVMGQPVFSITTPWGSPYLNMEKLTDMDEVVPADTSSTALDATRSVAEEQDEYRQVVLYFLDPDDAISIHGQMKQMENMKDLDIRVSSFSLSKALRQASNLGRGLLTGNPLDPITGDIDPDHGALRYKIVPPKRQLYYAARCHGKERVGLFSDNPAEDAQIAVQGNSALDAANLMRRMDKRDRKVPAQSKTRMQAANAHMEGYTGIPVFCIPEMKKRLPKLKQFVSGNQHEIPMFFNYEDMMAAWDTMAERNNNRKRGVVVPEKPSRVEVFNFWDVITSMDKNESVLRQRRDKTPAWKRNHFEPITKRFSYLFSTSSAKKEEPGLEHITFVPSSRSVEYKEHLSARGNGKARLRPMR